MSPERLGRVPVPTDLSLHLIGEQKQSQAGPGRGRPPRKPTPPAEGSIGRVWTEFLLSRGTFAAQELLLPIQNQVREKRLLFPAGVSVPPGEGLRKSLQTEHERQVGTMPHSLGGPAAAKITDKLTYKERFYFTSKPQRLTAEPPAGEQHRAAEASRQRRTEPGTSASWRSMSLKRHGEREGMGKFQSPS